MAEIAYTKKIHIAITILVMAIIFLHSAMPGDLSSAESNIIYRLIVGLTQLPDETGRLIRHRQNLLAKKVMKEKQKKTIGMATL